MLHLKIKGRSGPGVSTELIVYLRQRLCVGRTQQADHAITEDPLLSARHFEILANDESFEIIDLDSMNGTFVNNNRINRYKLLNDDIIRAGKSEFRVEIKGTLDDINLERETKLDKTPLVNFSTASGTGSISDSINTSARSIAQKPDTGFVDETAAKIIQKFKLAENLKEAKAVIIDVKPAEYVQELQKLNFLQEAIQFLSYALQPRTGVWWTTLCIRQVHPELPESEAALLQKVEAWVKAPKDDLRYEVMAEAEKQGMQTSTCWAAVSAFWSMGSMAPKGQPEVPVTENLYGMGISGAVMIASAEKEAAQVEEFRKAFLETGLKLAKGEGLWEKS